MNIDAASHIINKGAIRVEIILPMLNIRAANKDCAAGIVLVAIKLLHRIKTNFWYNFARIVNY